MSVFNLEASIAQAAKRLGRQGRADKGEGRLAAPVELRLRELLLQIDKPSITAVQRDLAALCNQLGLRPPARATVYNALKRLPVPSLESAELPAEVRASLYNLAHADGDNSSSAVVAKELPVPGDQLVFYAFNYGSPLAISYAAGLPWLCLQRAAERRGWRPKSRALLDAVMQYRGIGPSSGMDRLQGSRG